MSRVYASGNKTIKLCAGAGARTLTQINQEALCVLENTAGVVVESRTAALPFFKGTAYG